MDALRREGKEIQGLMRSLKDASGQYRNFSAGPLPAVCEQRGLTMERVGNTCKHNTNICKKKSNCKGTSAHRLISYRDYTPPPSLDWIVFTEWKSDYCRV